MLKVLFVLEAILEVVVEALKITCLNFLIWVFLYYRNVFSLSLKMVLCRFLKVGSTCFWHKFSLCWQFQFGSGLS